MRILITGAAGFVGSHLVPWFRNRGAEVSGVSRGDCDLRDPNAIKHTIRATRPEYIIHLASHMAPGREIADVQRHIEDNIVATANLCLAAPSDLKLLVLIGSSDEYGSHRAPFEETMTPHALSLYGWSKISAASLAEFVCPQRSVPYTWLRPSLFFGPRVSENLFFGHVLYKCIRNETVSLTACEQTRDFLYIDDFARMLELLLAHPEIAAGRIWNIASGQPRQLREVAQLIQRLVGRGHLNFGALPYRPNEIMDFYSDPTRFQSGFSPPVLTDFETAVGLTIEEAIAEVEPTS